MRNATKRIALGIMCIIAFLLGITAVTMARASSLDCESISDADHRNLCRAMSKHDSSFCEFITNKDLRYQCRAVAGER